MSREVLPDRLKDRPWDERRKVPVPHFNVMADGSVNYTGINAATVIECGMNMLCGICGKDLDYWIAFIGGPVSLANRTYSDPPMHRECAEAAMRYCPHIRVRNHRRTPDERQPEDSWASPLAVMEKPAEWIIALTRHYKMIPHDPGVLFRTDTIKHSLRYRYSEAGLLEPVE
jgi:hypothetical protein